MFGLNQAQNIAFSQDIIVMLDSNQAPNIRHQSFLKLWFVVGDLNDH